MEDRHYGQNQSGKFQDGKQSKFQNTARGIVGRVTDCGVRSRGFESPGSILTSRTETSSITRVVRDGWDPCSVPLSGAKKISWGGVFDLAIEQP